MRESLATLYGVISSVTRTERVAAVCNNKRNKRELDSCRKRATPRWNAANHALGQNVVYTSFSNWVLWSSARCFWKLWIVAVIVSSVCAVFRSSSSKFTHSFLIFENFRKLDVDKFDGP